MATHTVIAAAGRRIDPAGTIPASFPLSNVPVVKQRLRGVLEAHHATALVASAACGADLIALEEAGHLGIRRRVFLPFDRDRFRATSVTDRPGDWGPRYERLLNEIALRNDLIVVAHVTGAAAEFLAYTQTNLQILDDAETMARASGAEAMALLIWDGRPRKTDDLTQAFGESARKRGMRVLDIATLL